jgi:hypothetical protein
MSTSGTWLTRLPFRRSREAEAPLSTYAASSTETVPPRSVSAGR